LDLHRPAHQARARHISKYIDKIEAAERAAETKKAFNNEVNCLKTEDVFLVSRAGIEPTTYGLKVRFLPF
jgi:hypothetical protein